jgi:hypothetical protein
MTGHVLYPLNVLKEQHLDIYLTRQKHHQFQPHVLNGSIPKLGCFWDDVLHFTALHPKQIEEALKKFGYSVPLKYYEIDARRLDSERTTVYLNPPRAEGEPTKVTDFVSYEADHVQKFATIPDSEPGEKGLAIPTADEFLINYQAPYILYRGSIDITDAKVIEV